ncbi:MAG TPA: TetR/AcrR family transcriptional regulator [Streptosporangiaceae bacterium]
MTGREERPERATRKGRETDEAFREAARTVFARDGYLNAKISDIAAEAGKSVASFYNYYDTKADLLIALATEFHAEATQMAVLPYRSGLTRQEALREAVAGFWRTYAKRRGELIGVFQAAMLDTEFLDRWLDIRAEAVHRIARQIRQAQSEGFCPGVDPVLTASALSAMLEHFSYIWLGQGGERAVVQFDDERAIDTLATIWVNSVYWRPRASRESHEEPAAPADRPAAVPGPPEGRPAPRLQAKRLGQHDAARYQRGERYDGEYADDDSPDYVAEDDEDGRQSDRRVEIMAVALQCQHGSSSPVSLGVQRVRRRPETGWYDGVAFRHEAGNMILSADPP